MPRTKNNNSAPSKEKEIERLLVDGHLPADLIRRGFARGTTYKIWARVKGSGTSPLLPTKGSDGAENIVAIDLSLETDPEIVVLKKRLRTAQLERQIAEVSGPPRLEEWVRRLEQRVDELEQGITLLADEVAGCPLSGLHQEFECPCGSRGLLAAAASCTGCGRETRYGWWPKDSANRNR